MKIYSLFLILLAVVVALLSAPSGFAEEKTPLTTIRFDPEPGDYQADLEKVLTGALTADAEAQFELVAVYPVTGPRRLDKKKKKFASQSAGQILEYMLAHGVDEQHVTTRVQPDTSAKTTMVRVFLK